MRRSCSQSCWESAEVRCWYWCHMEDAALSWNTQTGAGATCRTSMFLNRCERNGGPDSPPPESLETVYARPPAAAPSLFAPVPGQSLFSKKKNHTYTKRLVIGPCLPVCWNSQINYIKFHHWYYHFFNRVDQTSVLRKDKHLHGVRQQQSRVSVICWFSAPFCSLFSRTLSLLPVVLFHVLFLTLELHITAVYSFWRWRSTQVRLDKWRDLFAESKGETKAAFTFVWDVPRVQLFRFQLLGLCDLKIFLLVLCFHSSLITGLFIILVLLRSSCFVLVGTDNIWKQQEQALLAQLTWVLDTVLQNKQRWHTLCLGERYIFKKIFSFY